MDDRTKLLLDGLGSQLLTTPPGERSIAQLTFDELISEKDSISRTTADAHALMQAMFSVSLAEQGGKMVNLLAVFPMLIEAWNAHQGFWQVDNKAEKIALIHSELSEMLDAVRLSKPGAIKMCEKEGLEKLTNEEEEAADVLVRLLDYAGHYNLRIGPAFIMKLAYNLSRPYKHGKAF